MGQCQHLGRTGSLLRSETLSSAILHAVGASFGIMRRVSNLMGVGGVEGEGAESIED
jgi:hypothetical protein